MSDIPVQLRMDSKAHKVLKYRSAQYGKPMGRFIEDLLRALKQRALRIHKRLGQGTYIDDAVIVRALIENDMRGGSEDDALNLVAVDLFQTEQDGIEATFENGVVA